VIACQKPDDAVNKVCLMGVLLWSAATCRRFSVSVVAFYFSILAGKVIEEKRRQIAALQIRIPLLNSTGIHGYRRS
jgi:hypothetical protein